MYPESSVSGSYTQWKQNVSCPKCLVSLYDSGVIRIEVLLFNSRYILCLNFVLAIILFFQFIVLRVKSNCISFIERVINKCIFCSDYFLRYPSRPSFSRTNSPGLVQFLLFCRCFCAKDNSISFSSITLFGQLRDYNMQPKPSLMTRTI